MMRSKSAFMTGLLLAGASVSLVGCSDTKLPEPGGGASAEVKVKVKSSELASTGGGGGGETGTDGGGATPGGAEPIKAGFGGITGTVKLEGAAPTPAQVTPNKDTEVCVAYASEKLLVGDGGGVANVFIFLDRAPANAPKPDTSVEAIFDQKNCIFLPHAMVVSTEQTIKILSGDPIAHNTHTKPKRNTEFNSTIPANDREGKTTFAYRRAEKEPVRVVCDYHAWMEAWHLPLDHPYGAVTDATGKFELQNVPSGVHKFKVWHEGCGFLEQGFEIRVQADETSDVTINYPVSRYTAGAGVDTKVIRIAFSN